MSAVPSFFDTPHPQGPAGSNPSNPPVPSADNINQAGHHTYPVFIHSRLDDFGLTAPEFRVYCHLARRAGRTGRAWSSVQNISGVCLLQGLTP